MFVFCSLTKLHTQYIFVKILPRLMNRVKQGKILARFFQFLAKILRGVLKLIFNES